MHSRGVIRHAGPKQVKAEKLSLRWVGRTALGTGETKLKLYFSWDTCCSNWQWMFALFGRYIFEREEPTYSILPPAPVKQETCYFSMQRTELSYIDQSESTQSSSRRLKTHRCLIQYKSCDDSRYSLREHETAEKTWLALVSRLAERGNGAALFPSPQQPHI